MLPPEEHLSEQLAAKLTILSGIDIQTCATLKGSNVTFSFADLSL